MALRLTAGFLAIFLSTVLAVAANTRAENRNILVIYTDDQRAETLQFMPLLSRRIASEKGWVFTQAYVTNPICCPARSELMLGRKQGTEPFNPVYRNEPPNGGPSRVDFDDTLPHRMQQRGYETLIGGKWFNQWRNVGPFVPPYWDHAFINLSLSFNPFQVLSGQGSPTGDLVEGRTQWVREHETTYVIDRLSEYLRSEREKPFFIYFAPFSPHLPAQVPDGAPNIAIPEWVAESPKPAKIERQMRSIAWLDGELDRLIDAVRRADPDALVIFASDNGMMWGEKGLFGKAKPYEGSIKVPLVVLDPRSEGKTIEAAINAPYAINRLVMGTEAAELESDDPLYFYSFYKKKDFGFDAWRAVRREIDGTAYKLIEFADGRFELYDLTNDPAEATPLADDDVKAELWSTLARLRLSIILDDRLPDARLLRRYEHKLRTWDDQAQCWFSGGHLPTGIHIRPDCRFGGVAQREGEYTFTIELRPKEGRDFSYYEEFTIPVKGGGLSSLFNH